MHRHADVTSHVLHHMRVHIKLSHIRAFCLTCLRFSKGKVVLVECARLTCDRWLCEMLQRASQCHLCALRHRNCAIWSIFPLLGVAAARTRCTQEP